MFQHSDLWNTHCDAQYKRAGVDYNRALERVLFFMFTQEVSGHLLSVLFTRMLTVIEYARNAVWPCLESIVETK